MRDILILCVINIAALYMVAYHVERGDGCSYYFIKVALLHHLLAFYYILFNTHFFQQTVGVSPLVHEVYHVANVYADATCELAVEPDV